MLKVVKVESNLPKPVKSYRFPPMPILYLENIEIKNKVIPSMINQPYEPGFTGGRSSDERPSTPTDVSRDGDVSVISDLRMSDFGSIPSDIDSNSVPDEFTAPQSRPKRRHSVSSSGSENSTNSNESDITNRLIDILKPKKNRDRQHGGHHGHHGRDERLPPTMRDLADKGVYAQKREVGRLFSGVEEQEDENKKRELLRKFRSLAEKFPEAQREIPEYSIHTDYDTMNKKYEEILQDVVVKSNVSDYEMYLMSGFQMVETGMGILGFDMSGFSRHQAGYRNKYKRYLIELGEKTYTPESSRYPVELRLALLILFNTGVFVAGKLLVKKAGKTFDSLNLQGGLEPEERRSSRKMREPDMSDIPELNELNIDEEDMYSQARS